MYYSLLLWDQLLCSGKIGVCFIQHKLTEISYNTPSVFTCSPPTIAIRYKGNGTFCSVLLCIYLLSKSSPTINIRYEGMGTFCSVPLCVYLLSKSPPTIAIRYEGMGTFCSVPLCIYLLYKSPPTLAMRYDGISTFGSVLNKRSSALLDKP